MKERDRETASEGRHDEHDDDDYDDHDDIDKHANQSVR